MVLADRHFEPGEARQFHLRAQPQQRSWCDGLYPPEIQRVTDAQVPRITPAAAQPDAAGEPVEQPAYGPCSRERSHPNRPSGAVSPYGRMGHAVQRRQQGHEQAAGPGRRTPGHVSVAFAALPAARRANHHSPRGRGWSPRAAGDDHDIVQFLAAGQDGDQAFCLRRHLIRCAPRAKSPHSAPSCRQLLRAWRRGLLAGLVGSHRRGPSGPGGAACHLMPSSY